jgi:hypothetical protein
MLFCFHLLIAMPCATNMNDSQDSTMTAKTKTMHSKTRKGKELQTRLQKQEEQSQKD